jgi:flagellar basal body-associated protein FliL
VNAFKGVGFKMSGKHRYIWLGVMLILCAVSIGAGTYLVAAKQPIRREYESQNPQRQSQKRYVRIGVNQKKKYWP